MDTEQELRKILERNQRVEKDKAWEISFIRKIFITIFTYVLALVFLEIIEADNAYLAAVVPAMGFWLSTLKVSPLRKWWEQKNNPRS